MLICMTAEHVSLSRGRTAQPHVWFRDLAAHREFMDDRDRFLGGNGYVADAG